LANTRFVMIALTVSTIAYASDAQAQYQWSLLVPNASSEVGRVQPAIGYNPVSNRLVVTLGYDTIGSTIPTVNGGVTDVWALTNANGTGGTPQWLNLIPEGAAGSPPDRLLQSSAYDQANNRLIVFGGCGGGCAPTLNDTWVLNL
jgi:hypothetical protein